MGCCEFLVGRMGIPCGSFKVLSVFYVTSEEHNSPVRGDPEGGLIHKVLCHEGRVCMQPSRLEH
jgi:hypothetical protein